MQTTQSVSTPNATRTFPRSSKGPMRRILGAVVLSLALLPAQNAAAISTTVNDQLGARAMTVCMLEGGKMSKNGNGIMCCIDRFCVSCADDEDCRVWTNKRPKLDSRLPRPEHSGATTTAPDPRVAPSQKGRDRGAAPEDGVVAPSHKRRDHSAGPKAGVVEQSAESAR